MNKVSMTQCIKTLEVMLTEETVVDRGDALYTILEFTRGHHEVSFIITFEDLKKGFERHKDDSAM